MPITLQPEIWECEGCKYRVEVKDALGRPVKKRPKTCPSCGRPTKKPEADNKK
jgi:rubrerythrin